MDFTFLEEDQIWGDDALDVMKKYGTAVAPTDLTVILGGIMRSFEGKRICLSWSASSIDKNACFVDCTSVSLQNLTSPMPSS